MTLKKQVVQLSSVRIQVSSREIPPVFTPPFVARNFGIPPAKIPPKPGGPSCAGGAAGVGRSALPVLLALALVFVVGGGLSPSEGTGGAPLGGSGPPLAVFADGQNASNNGNTQYRCTPVICHSLFQCSSLLYLGQ